MKRHTYFKLITISEIIMIIISIIIGLMTIHLFYVNDQYWDNGPLPGYEQASAILDLCDNIRGKILFVFILINIILGMISIIKMIIPMLSKNSVRGEATYNLLCWFITVWGTGKFVIIYFITQVFTYATGI